MTYSPWRDVSSRYPDVAIGSGPCRPAHAAWVPDLRVIVLEESLTQGERRSALAHELAHLDLGHGQTDGWFGHRHESDACRLAATRLISLEHLASALRWSQDEIELADELWVDVATVRTRLKELTTEEKLYIDKRLWAEERGA